MAKRFYFIDDSVTAGQNTVAAIENESGTFGIGATTALEPDLSLIHISEPTRRS